MTQDLKAKPLVWGYQSEDGEIFGPYAKHVDVVELSGRCLVFAFTLGEGESFETNAQKVLDRAS